MENPIKGVAIKTRNYSIAQGLCFVFIDTLADGADGRFLGGIIYARDRTATATWKLTENSPTALVKISKRRGINEPH